MYMKLEIVENEFCRNSRKFRQNLWWWPVARIRGRDGLQRVARDLLELIEMVCILVVVQSLSCVRLFAIP